jgi:plasmid maintenance system antidote protein VapI
MKNLIQEMKINHVTPSDLAAFLGTTREEIEDKIKNQNVTLTEALKIQGNFFPYMSVESLFG